jgi:hypothetical protein
MLPWASELAVSTLGGMSISPPQPDAHRLDIPLRLGDGTTATVVELSPSAMYFEMEGDRPIVGPLVFEMQLPGTRLKFTAQCDVERIDALGTRRGVQVRLRQLRLRALD